MCKRIYCSALLIISLFALSAQALPIVDADAFTTGDNKAALETGTGLIWMDFGVNYDKTYGEVVSELDTTYAGWRLPTQSEVIHLWTGLFSTIPGWAQYTPTLGLVQTKEDVRTQFESIFSVLGTNADTLLTGIDNNGNFTTWAVKDEFGIFKFDNGNFGIVVAALPYEAGYPTNAVFQDSPNDLNNVGGALLIKAELPEPSAIALFTLGIFGIFLNRRRKLS